LQFDVLKYRLATEYGVPLNLKPMLYELARWPQTEFDLHIFDDPERIKLVEDRESRPVLLVRSGWHLERVLKRHPELKLSATADPHSFG
jgi:peptide chain release factor 3